MNEIKDIRIGQPADYLRYDPDGLSGLPDLLPEGRTSEVTGRMIFGGLYDWMQNTMKQKSRPD